MRKEKGRGERDGNKGSNGESWQRQKKIIKRWSAKIRRDADKGREREERKEKEGKLREIG